MNAIIQFGRFGLVGLLNTLITLLVIAVLTWLGASPFVANAVGFAAGLVNSYFGNMKWTFKSNSSWGKSVRFLIAFGVCYSINVFVLYTSLPMERINVLVPQVLAMATYTVSFFVLSKLWVFRN
ncbi:GtrA family protein [Brucella intermedia]|uniref:GtrA family protein n=1 Tax=Brucella intermedia TaxID=94625 RepID=UPI00244EA72B|nr:GtrA family protein [Brucella intermedia]WGJ07220.1 GtrA family protein [Brucella intermedia]